MAVEIVDNGITENPEIQAPTEVNWEAEASELGWRPKEEFTGDEKDFVEAREFVQRKPLFDKIEGQSKQIKDMNRTLEAFKKHFSKATEVATERALAALEAQKIQAFNEGDGQKFQQVEKQIKQAEREKQQIEREFNAPPQGSEPQEFVDWKAKNTWFDKDADLREYADLIGPKLHSQGMSPGEVLAEVTRKVKQQFPHKFTNPNKDRAPDVGVSSGRGGSNRVDPVEAGMSDDDKQMMKVIIRSGVSKEEYLKQYKEISAKSRR